MFMLWCAGTPIIGSVPLPLSDSNRMELPLSSEDHPEQLHCPYRAGRRGGEGKKKGGERDDRG